MSKIIELGGSGHLADLSAGNRVNEFAVAKRICVSHEDVRGAQILAGYRSQGRRQGHLPPVKVKERRGEQHTVANFNM